MSPPINKATRQKFFIFVGTVYKLLPSSFKSRVSSVEFYPYVRDKGGFMGYSLKAMNNKQFSVYAHNFIDVLLFKVLAHYYSDINILTKLVAKLYKDHAHFFNALTHDKNNH